ncbi:MAG: bifunctional riboflavin kinase/FAD synthetase [Flavobacteriaceae bacterium]|nr:bifunctional riboflavin kinase/FAD synthetase [Flavobacteriaceae bacterium]
MKVFSSISEFNYTKKTIVTIGTFDGVHIGHQKIIEKLIQETKNSNCESLILTFFPHPRMILHKKSPIKLLNTISEKSSLLEKMGLENLIIHPFDKEFSNLSAEDFVKTILVDSLNIKKIIIGYDHRFGKNRDANIEDLIAFGRKYSFEVEQISAQEIDSVSVSSTKIRDAIANGTMAVANEYLGYDYLLSGKIIKGKQLGSTIGFPTANIKIEENYKLIPKNGVYVVKSHLQGKTVFGIMNIGFNPTVNGEYLSIEVHFLDFNADLYNTQISVSVIARIRDEEKFTSLDLLKTQIQKDKNYAISIIEKMG